MTAAVPGPFRDQLAEALDPAFAFFHPNMRRKVAEEWADRLMPLIEARVQAAANQRAAEVLRAAAMEQRNEADNVWDTDEGTHADGHRCAADFLDRRAGLITRLAQPATDTEAP